MLIEQRPFDDSELAALVVDQQVELRGRDGNEDPRVFPVDPAGRYLVAVLGGDGVACGGLKAHDIDTVEITRMYVRPRYRGRGFARQMLSALEDLAESRGHRVVRLESGVYLPEAISLYLAAGYRPIPRFGQYARNAASRCFEKRLDGTERPVRMLRCAASDPKITALLGSSPVADPTTRFVLATVDGEPAACGAIQPMDDQTVEIRFLFVRGPHRGTGLGVRVLSALEDLAAGASYQLGRVAGDVEDNAIYEAAGYRGIASYGPYVGNPARRCYEKMVIVTEAVA